MEALFASLLAGFSDMGYVGIFALMAIESSFIPFPSEIVVPPAAYLATQGVFNIYYVVIFGVLGSLFGACVNYSIARFLGRPLVYELSKKKWVKWLLLSEKKVLKAEKYFLNYGGVSTFLGRLVPAIRQLISLPAGFVRMNFLKFLFYTGLGSFLWVSVLAALGYYFGQNEELLRQYYKEISYILIGITLFVIFTIYVFKRRKR